MKTLLRVAWFALVCAVCVMSMLPPDSEFVDPLSSINDKLLHLGAYAALAFLPAVHEPPKLLSGMLVFVALLGGLLEMAQAAGALGRSFEYLDLAANLAGGALGAVAAWPVRRRLIPG